MVLWLLLDKNVPEREINKAVTQQKSQRGWWICRAKDYIWMGGRGQEVQMEVERLKGRKPWSRRRLDSINFVKIAIHFGISHGNTHTFGSVHALSFPSRHTLQK